MVLIGVLIGILVLCVFVAWCFCCAAAPKIPLEVALDDIEQMAMIANHGKKHGKRE